ncbi:hypothetical protein HK405_015745, partial [Cladochytrium tenue]
MKKSKSASKSPRRSESVRERTSCAARPLPRRAAAPSAPTCPTPLCWRYHRSRPYHRPLTLTLTSSRRSCCPRWIWPRRLPCSS